MPKLSTLSMAELSYHFGVRVCVYPSTEQKRLIKRNSDASRFIYNEMVAMNRELYTLRQVKCPISLVLQRITTLQERLKRPSTGISNIHGWLNHPDFDADMKANAIKNYRTAWKLFKQVHQFGVPQFHKRNARQSYQTSNHYQSSKGQPTMTNGSVRLLDRHHLTIGKIGRLRFAGMPKWLFTRTDNIRIGTTTVSMDATGSYFVSFQLASTQPFVSPSPKTGAQIGIDLNLDNFLTDSNGNTIANPRYYRQMIGKLAKAQRKLSRRARRAKQERRQLNQAKNYQKQRLAVAQIHQRVANQRKSFLHQLSTTLVKNHDLVVTEELRSKNLLKNHALAMSISDVGWRQFLTMLAYKAALHNKQFVTVDPKNTTQTCHVCGFVMGTANTHKLTLVQREWDCPQCGQHHIRDWNAAQNILAKGLAAIG
ncbi:RNA-guided endonuclease InsQ/TnpB family protein [Lacticaseibacillus jixianensis]|uniref:RNA-guided endonuclease InsQ/TnpB family protein n=1 Tax=Lacticaseibacillus jixianensis TaxID=2486012 RepID=A0ABW4B7C2_9LACO|nr:RNA-guided endonuclease TnpB family protein [Lacticaseibacillus jixianensis]